MKENKIKEEKELAEIEQEIEKAEEKLSVWRQIGLFIYETVKLIVVVFVIVFLIRYFLVQPFYVVGDSMYPNLKNGEYLLVDEISYRLHEPHRGDIIVFRFPGNPRENYIKRIIGLPGEKIQVIDGKVKVTNAKNPAGAFLEEPYLASDLRTEGDTDMTLGQDEFFVLGDNRKASSDSRSWGFVPRKNIIGRTAIVLFPANRLQLIKNLTYNIDK